MTAWRSLKGALTARYNHGGEMQMKLRIAVVWYLVLVSLPITASGQAADWQQVIWREPQVRYLLADMNLGGDVATYRKYATEERDPDSREAIRLWDMGARVVNLKAFERKWVKNDLGKEGRVMRVVLRDSDRTITGDEVFLTSDRAFEQAPVRRIIAELSLGATVAEYDSKRADPNVAEALRRWRDGAQLSNTDWFELSKRDDAPRLVYRGTHTLADGARVKLNSDVSYSEANVRYFLTDMYLGGSRDFYFRVAQSAHETGCAEAVLRFDAHITIANLDQFERKRVRGKVVVTRKGTDQRIKGADVKLSTD